jgi:protein subunit release factor B
VGARRKNCMARQLLFSITKKDFDIQTFSVGGHGGGGKDTSNSGVRLIHRDSGAVGEGRETRSNHQNRRAAFRRLIETPQFKNWHRQRCSELMYGRTIDQFVETIDQLVDNAMRAENLKIEYM